MDYSEALKILKKYGYKENINISDFWFQNNESLKKAFKKIDSTYYQTFELIVRWKSDIGDACQNAIKNYISDKIEERRKNSYFDPHNPNISFEYALIEFSNFKFVYEGKSYSILEFTSNFETSKLFGMTDLRGIDLSGIQLSDSNLLNCDFSNANLDRSNFQQLKLTNCNFIKSSFVNSRLVSIIVDKKSSFQNANFSNSFLNAINFDDSSFGNIKYIKISYLFLFKILLLKIINKSNYMGYRHNENLKFTHFLSISSNGLESPMNRELRKYIDWFQYVMLQIENFNTLNIFFKIYLIINIILTKYWTSALSLVSYSALINLIFAIIYFLNSKSFKLIDGISSNFFHFFSYSMSIFTSYSFGDTYPQSNFLQILVLLEMIIGYFFLGIFIFLMSRKLDSKY